mmetsp:Transcript_11102/g.31223  ORF Transcript_11102/g.31223 Transcript_11102/m.31223 type:complete len:233 (-) Transcript_11102:890-1588(-)
MLTAAQFAIQHVGIERLGRRRPDIHPARQNRIGDVDEAVLARHLVPQDHLRFAAKVGLQPQGCSLLALAFRGNSLRIQRGLVDQVGLQICLPIVVVDEGQPIVHDARNHGVNVRGHDLDLISAQSAECGERVVLLVGVAISTLVGRSSPGFHRPRHQFHRTAILAVGVNGREELLLCSSVAAEYLRRSRPHRKGHLDPYRVKVHVQLVRYGRAGTGHAGRCRRGRCRRRAGR